MAEAGARKCRKRPSAASHRVASKGVYAGGGSIAEAVGACKFSASPADAHFVSDGRWAKAERIVSWLAPGGKVYIEVPDLAPQHSHFAHVIGFNHWNLILAAAEVTLAPLRVVAPTGIIFAPGRASRRR